MNQLIGTLALHAPVSMLSMTNLYPEQVEDVEPKSSLNKHPLRCTICSGMHGGGDEVTWGCGRSDC